MKLIRVTYRATFQQPKQGPLNPMGCKITSPIPVEVYAATITGSKWLARTIPLSNWDAPKPETWPLQHGATAEQMRLNVAEAFETQLTPWEMWGNPERITGLPRLLQPEEVKIRENGQVYFKDPSKELKTR